MNKNIIAIDMSTELCSIAIKYKKKIFTKYKFSKKQNSRFILILFNKIIKKQNIKIKKINIFMYNKGPGSIIGTRLSYNIAKIFKFKYKNIKIIKFNSFQIIKEMYNKNEIFFITIYSNFLDIKLYQVHKKKSKLKIIKNFKIFKKKILIINKKNIILVNNYQFKKKIINLIPNINCNKIKIIYPKAKYMILKYIKKNYFK